MDNLNLCTGTGGNRDGLDTSTCCYPFLPLARRPGCAREFQLKLLLLRVELREDRALRVAVQKGCLVGISARGASCGQRVWHLMMMTFQLMLI